MSLGTSARADDGLRPQLQIDGGLSVIGPAYEQPVARRIAIGVEAFVFGTYFLPWFDAGEEVRGLGVGVRPTWFARDDGSGLYVAPFVRGVAVDPEDIAGFTSYGFSAGVFAGWTFRLSERIDLRVGGGGQYYRFRDTSTPFVAIDGVIGYRL